jgi:hypothetical protein
MKKSNMGILKWPLLITAVVVILRVVLERAGVSDSLNNVLSVAVLHTLLVPIYIAVRLGKSGDGRPYLSLFKLIAIYAVLARIMILPTYWAARVFEWTNPRFGGLWGPDVNAFVGFVGVPVGTALVWIVASIVVGGLIGSIVLAVTRRKK